jgi:hypothetical protein
VRASCITHGTKPRSSKRTLATLISVATATEQVYEPLLARLKAQVQTVRRRLPGGVLLLSLLERRL